jgi:hypothetical protein
VEDQSDKVTTIRQKNESLVHNILPTHVAQNFLGANKRNEVCTKLAKVLSDERPDRTAQLPDPALLGVLCHFVKLWTSTSGGFS